jgi:hypothetical protein
MKTQLAIIMLAGVTVACTPHYKKGEVAYDFVGCHTVGAENPKNGETLEIGKVQTATPCK